MKINLTEIDFDNFVCRPVEIAGEQCTLVFPQHIGCKWSKQNLHFRSSIWNSEGELISASFKKFFNWSEQPDLAYTPFSLTANGGCQILEKLDGSTLIVSKYKGELIVRTRGTADATILDNGNEIALLMEKYPKAFQFDEDTANHSRIFEWESIQNRIVIKHAEIDMKLIAMIDHNDYSLFTQFALDLMATEFEVPRPRWFEFKSIKDMQNKVKAFSGLEGVCVYCNKGQDIRKLKGDEYLAKHRLKDQLCNFDRVVEYYFAHNKPEYQEFYDSVVNDIDWETAEEIRGDISNICDGIKEVKKLAHYMAGFVEPLKTIPRKEAAEKIL